MDFVCIDMLEGDGLTARTVAIWSDDHFDDNITYTLKDTPCGEAVGKTICCFPSKVRQLFPKDIVLQEMCAESYVGVTLFSHTLKPIGLIAVIGRKPLKDRWLAETMMEMVGVRAAAEMERLDAEEALRERTERYELVMAGASAAIWDWDVPNKRVFFSPQWKSMRGYAENEVSDSEYEWKNNIHPDDISRVMAALKNHFKEQTPVFEEEYRVRCKNGSYKWISDRGISLFDKAGIVLRMAGSEVDITERKNAEEKRELNEIRLKTMLNIIQYRANTSEEFLKNALNEVLKLTGSKIGYILFYNEESKQFTLNTWSYAVMEECRIVQPPTVYELEKTGIWGEAVRQRTAIIINDYNSYHSSKKGYSEGHVNINKFMTIPVFSNDKIGAVVGVANKERDYNEIDVLQLTLLMDSVWKFVEIKRGEDALRESEERFKALHNASFGGIAIHDKGVILECNQGLSDMTGYSIDELIGMNGLLLISEKTRDMVMSNILAGYEKPYEAVGLRKNGEKYPMRLEARNIPYKGKNVRVVEFRDITEQKKMEEELRINIVKYRTLFDVLPVGITVSDNAGNILESNNAAEKIFGLSREEHSKRKIDGEEWRIINEDSSSMSPEDFPASIALRDNCPVENVVMGIVKDNNEVTWLSVSSTPVPLEDYGVVIAYSDISERKRAEDALRENEEKFRLAFHTTPDSINLNRFEDGCYIDINKGFTKIMGYTSEEAIGKTSLELSIWKNPEDRARLVDCLKKKGFVENMEAQFVGKDGSIRDGLMSASVLKINDENVIISITRDNTERKKAQDALRESEEKYRSMMESMDDAAFICSSEHAIEYMNPAMSKRVGYNSIGEFCYKSIYGFNEPCPWCLSKKVLDGDSIKTEVVSPNDNKNYSVSFSPIFHTDNTVSVLHVLRDITDIKTIENRLQQSQKMEAIGALAGGIAHDFNNILSPIMGYTELLSEDIPKESPLRSSLDEIYAASMRAKDMVRQILTFSRQEKSEVRLMKMQHIVKEALKLIRSTIPATIDIKQDIRKECGLINADPTQIHQIVMNLATNAYHAMEETGGTMRVSLKEAELNPELNEQDIVGQDIQKGIYACLTVSDTGAGIPEDIRDKIFDPFFTTKKQGKGTGLGLSSVHGILTSCGGFIRLHSELGRGTEFNIYLPVAESYLKKDDVLKVNMPMLGGNERILLVDDEAVLITLQKGMLERLGYNVTSRTSSIEALEAFRSNPDKFDMVITDMAMPSMSGDKLAVELIKIRPDIPVLLCTGFSTIMSEEKAISMGIKGFLMKPVTISDIDKKIRDVLDSNK